MIFINNFRYQSEIFVKQQTNKEIIYESDGNDKQRNN